jgi:hypothetical protein
LRIADCGLRIADCGLRIADCGLRIARRPTIFGVHQATTSQIIEMNY